VSEQRRCPTCGHFLPGDYQGIWCVPCLEDEDRREQREIEKGWL
jgi:hypothetical protein